MKIYNGMKKFNNKLFSFLFFLFILFFAHTVFAASLLFSPSSGSYNVGDTINMRMVLSSTDQSANAVSGSLTFSNNLLILTSLSKANSLVSLWAQDPSYSNANGTVDMEGVILNGYSGSNGTIVNLSFKAKAVGTASIKFASSSVLANDGQGTNILTNAGQASFNISPQKQKPISPPVIVAPTSPPAVIVLTPVFTDYSKDVKEGDFIVVKGFADPLMTITINSDGVLSSTEGVVHNSTTLKSDDKGVFDYVSDRATAGIYMITAQATNGDGVMSEKTSPIKISVFSPTIPTVSITTNIMNILSGIIPIIGLIIMIILILIWGWYNIKHYKEYMHKKLAHMEETVSKNFEVLNKDVKDLSIDQLQKDMAAAQKTIMVDIKESEK